MIENLAMVVKRLHACVIHKGLSIHQSWICVSEFLAYLDLPSDNYVRVYCWGLVLSVYFMLTIGLDRIIRMLKKMGSMLLSCGCLQIGQRQVMHAWPITHYCHIPFHVPYSVHLVSIQLGRPGVYIQQCFISCTMFISSITWKFSVSAPPI